MSIREISRHLKVTAKDRATDEPVARRIPPAARRCSNTDYLAGVRAVVDRSRRCALGVAAADAPHDARRARTERSKRASLGAPGRSAKRFVRTGARFAALTRATATPAAHREVPTPEGGPARGARTAGHRSRSAGAWHRIVT